MYKTSTKLQHEREALIAEAVSDSTDRFTFFEYQSRRSELPIIRLDLSIPIYRMANFRTRTAQLKYIHDHQSHADFFSSGQENEEAQQAQHEILKFFANRGTSSVTPIKTELQTDEQRQPLLITGSGVVVNGNRRLAAMRELFAEDPALYQRYSHVDCAVLPSAATPEEVREIEVRLQMRPETKLPYGWIDESIAIQELLDSGKPIEYIADLVNKSRKDVLRAAQALTEVDIYLKEWAKQPGEYQIVEDREQFFGDLAKALSGIEGEMQEVKRRIAWVIVSNPDELSRRMYDYNLGFDSKTDQVVSALVERLGVDIDQSTNDDDNDDLDIDLGDSDTGPGLEPLLAALDDPSQRENVATELIDVCDSIFEQERQGAIGKQALDAIRKANTKLLGVDLSKAAPRTYGAIAAQLGEILKTILARYTDDR